jgi:hypothetical protein
VAANLADWLDLFKRKYGERAQQERDRFTTSS